MNAAQLIKRTVTTSVQRVSAGRVNSNRNGNCGCPSKAGGAHQAHQTQFSAKAQMLMMMMSMMNQLMGGSFGQLMNSLNPNQGQMVGMNNNHPGFGQSGFNPGFQMTGHQPQGGYGVGGARSGANVGGMQMNPNAPRVAPGQVKEMKAGETVRGANGSQVNWGEDGSVNIGYKGKDGKLKRIHVKDGMMSLDGGKPVKLENTGQFLKLPNGDVVGIGNTQHNGKKQMVRVAVSDGTAQVPTSPPRASNIYDISQMEHKQTTMQGGGINMNFSAGSFQTPMGTANFMNASISAFAGVPVTQSFFGPQMMNLVGVK